MIDKLLPVITEGMAEMALVRPSDPYLWLSRWINDHKPPKALPLTYDDPVLGDSLLKSDRFEGISKLKGLELT